MLSAICIDLDPSKILSSGNGLTWENEAELKKIKLMSWPHLKGKKR